MVKDPDIWVPTLLELSEQDIGNRLQLFVSSLILHHHVLRVTGEQPLEAVSRS